jgi:ribosome-associated toxin RatA of RatAB toxin-antitoxin module
MLQKIISVLFGEAVKRMVLAFEQRAEVLYGHPKVDSSLVSPA